MDDVCSNGGTINPLSVTLTHNLPSPLELLNFGNIFFKHNTVKFSALPPVNSKIVYGLCNVVSDTYCLNNLFSFIYTFSIIT